MLVSSVDLLLFVPVCRLDQNVPDWIVLVEGYGFVGNLVCEDLLELVSLIFVGNVDSHAGSSDWFGIFSVVTASVVGVSTVDTLVCDEADIFLVVINSVVRVLSMDISVLVEEAGIFSEVITSVD